MIEPFTPHVISAELDDLGRRLRATRWPEPAIDGLAIHFVDARSPHRDAFSIILTHGWPGSVIEFLETLPLLTEAGFHCVVPSLPGYGFSEKPSRPGWTVERIARAWATLMDRLDYARYGAAGSDWDTSISASLGQQDLNTWPASICSHRWPGSSRQDQSDDDAGYPAQQRTRPQTIGYALTDSPPRSPPGSPKRCAAGPTPAVRYCPTQYSTT